MAEENTPRDEGDKTFEFGTSIPADGSASKEGSSSKGNASLGSKPSADGNNDQASTQRYRYIREQGRGGVGVVHLAMDTTFDREVALKELLPLPLGTLSTQQLQARSERFLREARISGQLEHPNIIPVYDMSDDGAADTFYSMKFVRGDSMQDRLKQIEKDSTPDDNAKMIARLNLLDAFVDVCNGVAFANDKGVVHRDLKPENIMLGDFGETLVVDWGLALVLGASEVEMPHEAKLQPDGETESSDRLTMDGAIMGTPAYMPPEQARGELEKLSARSDVYALGAILFEILSGERSVKGTSAMEIVSQSARGKIRDISEIGLDLPPELEAIVKRAMAFEPEERFASAKELADEISAWRAGSKVSIYQYSSWELLKRFVAANRGKLTAAALMLLALAGFGALDALQEHNAQNSAIDERAEELIKSRSRIDNLNVQSLLDDSTVEIADIESRQKAYDATTPVPALDAAKEIQSEDINILLEASSRIDEYTQLAALPVREKRVQFLKQEDFVHLNAQSLALRKAASKLAALRGAWKFADEILRSTPLPNDEKHSLRLYVQNQRELLKTMRSKRITAVLDDVRTGIGRPGRSPSAPTLEEYVFELVTYRDQATVAILKRELQRHVGYIKRERSNYLARNIKRTAEEQKLVPLPPIKPILWLKERRELVTLCVRVLGKIRMGLVALDALSPLCEVVHEPSLSFEIARSLASIQFPETWIESTKLHRDLNMPTWGFYPLVMLEKRLPQPSAAPNEKVLPGKALAYGRACFANKNYQAASSWFKVAAKTPELETSATRLHALALFKVGRKRDALLTCSERRESLPFALQEGLFHLWDQEYDEAFSCFTRTISMAPENSDAYAWRACALRDKFDLLALESGQPRENSFDPQIRSDLEAALSRDSKNTLAHSALGSFYLRADKHKLALKHFSRACSLAPSALGLHSDKASTLMSLGDHVGAVQALRQALLCAADNEDLKYTWRRLAGLTTDPMEKLEALGALCTLLPEDGMARVRFAHALTEADHSERAVEVLNSAVRHENMSSLHRILLAKSDVYFRKGNFEQSLEIVQAAIDNHTPALRDEHGDYSLAAAMLLKSHSLGRLGRQDEALQTLLAASRLYPREPKLLYELSELHAARKEWGDVIRLLDLAISLRDGQQFYYLRRAEAKDALSLRDEALKDFDRALENSREGMERASFLVAKAHVLEKLGSHSLAAESLKAAFRIADSAKINGQILDYAAWNAGDSQTLFALRKSALENHFATGFADYLLGTSLFNHAITTPTQPNRHQSTVEFESAIAHLTTAISKENYRVEALEARAIIATYCECFGSAREDLKLLLKIDSLGDKQRGLYSQMLSKTEEDASDRESRLKNYGTRLQKRPSSSFLFRQVVQTAALCFRDSSPGKGAIYRKVMIDAMSEFHIACKQGKEDGRAKQAFERLNSSILWPEIKGCLGESPKFTTIVKELKVKLTEKNTPDQAKAAKANKED